MKTKKALPVAFIFAGTAYAISMGILWAKQAAILYRAPKKVFSDDQPEVILPSSNDNPSLKGWIDGPKETSECILYLGGSSESVELRRESLAEVCPDMTRYFIPYRGFGPNYGEKITEKSIKEDSLKLFDLISKKHQKVHVIARSLGTGVGLHVAANRNVASLSLITPYDSIAAVAAEKYKVVPVRKILRDHFESWRDAPKIKDKALVCIAGLDKVISSKRWNELRKHFKVDPIEELFVECNHSDIAQCKDMWNRIAKHIKEHKNSYINNYNTENKRQNSI